MTMQPKKIGTTVCKVYHTIVLLILLSKIIIKIVYDRIYNKIDNNVSENQFSFCKKERLTEGNCVCVITEKKN